MIPAIERPRSIPETLRQKPLRTGVGIAVINPDGRIWIQKDAKSRQETDRIEGFSSIIFESRKGDESVESNVTGGLAELVNNRVVPLVAEHLHTTDGLRSTPTLIFEGEHADIEYSLTVLVYDHNDAPFEPYDKTEVGQGRWSTIDAVLAQQDVRPLARAALEYLRVDGTIERKLAEYHDVNRRQLVIDPNFSIENFYDERERFEDTVGEVVLYTAA